MECSEKNWYFPHVHSTSENTDIFTNLDEIYLEIWSKHDFPWSLLAHFYFCSVFVGYNNGCKLSLLLENSLETYFNM